MDAGGTMTDTIVVDEHGNFAIGKALTTPQDESVGFFRSVGDALSYWDYQQELTFPELEASIYAGTTILNTLLQRRGRKVGLITTNGFEDDVIMGRGVQVWKSYAYSDRLHAVTHVHPQPLVSRRNVYGVTERIDCFGEEIIPLYGNDVEEATRKLIQKGVEAIVVHFLYTYLNDSHEKQAGEIIRRILQEEGREDIEVFLSAQVRPAMRENERLNCALIEAYAAAPSRTHLFKIESAERQKGFRHELQTVLAYGGLCNIRYPRLHETLISGPVGGVMAGQYIAKLLNEHRIICTDMGGTSFDIGAITDGYIPVDTEPTIAGFSLSLPTINLETIGAGAGSYIRLDPVTKKIQLGPDGAGAAPGPVCFDRGGTTLTVTDCDVVLGYLNPDYFLGGAVKLKPELALAAVKEQLADPLGVDPYSAAESMVKMLGIEARNTIRTVAGIRGLDTADYVLFSYGGAGPAHVFQYTAGLTFKGIVTFKFAAALSALGTTVGDYMHRYAKSTHLYLPPVAPEDMKMAVGKAMNLVWAELEKEAYAQMEREGIPQGQVSLEHLVMMRYAGQLNDLEATSPVTRVESPADMDLVIQKWEELYGRINRRISKYEAAGYQVFELGVIARTSKVKPILERHELGGAEPPKEAWKGERSAYFNGDWVTASVWEMGPLHAGNVIEGPAILEAPSTTLVVPPGSRVHLDEYEFLWLEHGDWHPSL
jgi:N-methylhydantoinase A